VKEYIRQEEPPPTIFPVPRCPYACGLVITRMRQRYGPTAQLPTRLRALTRPIRQGRSRAGNELAQVSHPLMLPFVKPATHTMLGLIQGFLSLTERARRDRPNVELRFGVQNVIITGEKSRATIEAEPGAPVDGG